MQRRATVVFAAFFLVVAAGSYAFTGMVEEPGVSIEEPNREHVVSGTGNLAVGGVDYDVTSLDGEAGSAEARWLNESARVTATLANNSTVAYQGGNYTVVVPNTSSPESFALREVQSIDRPTVTQNGTRYVIVEEEGDRTLVPVGEYLPDPTRYAFRTGDEFAYENNTTTVAAITPEEVTLERFVDRYETKSFGEGENTTLDDTAYLAHFPDASTMVLTTAYQDYRDDEDRIDYFHERRSGVWGVFILSSMAAILLVGMAYLPSRY